MAAQYIKAVANFLKTLPAADIAIQKQQTDLILEKIKISSTDEAAAVVLALKELPVQEEFMAALINRTTTLALQSQQAQQLTGRKSTQDYTNLWQYMSPLKWSSLQQASDKLNWFAHEPACLGLTNPSEKTFQLMTALLLLSDKTPARDVPPGVKFESLKALKYAFGRAKVTVQGDVTFTVLPPPLELVEKHAAVAAAFFGEAGWTATEIEQRHLVALVDSIPMRCSRKDSKVQLVLDTKQDSNTAQYAQQLSQHITQQSQCRFKRQLCI